MLVRRGRFLCDFCIEKGVFLLFGRYFLVDCLFLSIFAH